MVWILKSFCIIFPRDGYIFEKILVVTNPFLKTCQKIPSHDITYLKHIRLYYSVFHITFSNSDEDFRLNKKKSDMIISHTKKNINIFVFGQNSEVGTRRHNKRITKHTSFFRFYFFLHTHTHTHTYIYISERER